MTKKSNAARPDGSAQKTDSAGVPAAAEETLRALRDRVTELEAQLATVRASEEKFRIIANHTFNWESWFGPDGTCIWVNPATKHIPGYAVEEVVGLPLGQFVDMLVFEEERPLFLYRAQQALRGEPVADFEFRYLHRNGVCRWGITSWRPVRGANGEFLGIRASGRDTDDHKRAEAEK